MKAWHFVGETLCDGRAIPADGEWLEHDGALLMCERGLHFSLHPFDALKYAPGATLCRVEVEDYILDDDKGVAQRRQIIARRDATAGRCALRRAQQRRRNVLRRTAQQPIPGSREAPHRTVAI